MTFYKEMKTSVALIILNSVIGLAQTKNQSDWQFKKTENGISVYTKDLENSNLKELKAIFQVKSSLSSIVALLIDSEAFPQWAYRCGQCSTLKKISEQEFIRYQTVVAPWPVDDRDFVVKVKVSQNPITKVVFQHVTNNPGFIPKVNGKERITVFKALWILTPLKNNTVNVEYQLMVDPGGNIPTWLVNFSATDGPLKNAQIIKEIVLKEKYKNAVLPYIAEL
jgi:hypothetical protein